MRVLVNGVRLFFDVEGASLVPDGPAMREKPTVGYNRSGTEPLRLVIFYMSDPDSPFLDPIR